MAMDRAKGKGKEVLGDAKQKVGRQTGDEDMEAEGTGDKAEGKAQDLVGKGKQTLDKAKDKVT